MENWRLEFDWFELSIIEFGLSVLYCVCESCVCLINSRFNKTNIFIYIFCIYLYNNTESRHELQCEFDDNDDQRIIRYE
jgi:hypothetical protein